MRGRHTGYSPGKMNSCYVLRLIVTKLNVYCHVKADRREEMGIWRMFLEWHCLTHQHKPSSSCILRKEVGCICLTPISQGQKDFSSLNYTYQTVNTQKSNCSNDDCVRSGKGLIQGPQPIIEEHSRDFPLFFSPHSFVSH